MAHAIFYTHQTSGACAGVCVCYRKHQIEKTVFGVILVSFLLIPNRYMLTWVYCCFRLNIFCVKLCVDNFGPLIILRVSNKFISHKFGPL